MMGIFANTCQDGRRETREPSPDDFSNKRKAVRGWEASRLRPKPPQRGKKVAKAFPAGHFPSWLPSFCKLLPPARET